MINRAEASSEHAPDPDPVTVTHGSLVQTAAERVGVNGKIGLIITRAVGTMWTAYLFAIVALVSLPAAIHSGDKVVIISWIAQTFLQLVLLPIILVGQNVQARAADKRSQQSYRDTEAILLVVRRTQAHLDGQDILLRDLAQRLNHKPPSSESEPPSAEPVK